MASTLIMLLRPQRQQPHAIRGLCFLASHRNFSSYLVTPRALHEALKRNAPSPISTEPRVIPLCAAWFLPNDPESRTGIDVFRKQRIPRARFFDLDHAVDRHSAYPHMLPSPRGFASAMSELGIRPDDTVVVYDSAELGILSAPRVAWTLRLFGHPNVHILNNFRLYRDQSTAAPDPLPPEAQQDPLPIESGDIYTVECSSYPIPSSPAHHRVADFEHVREAALDHGKEGAEGVQILDARSTGRFSGTAAEPRPGLPSGHMPGAINIPFDEVLDPRTKAFLPAEQLRRVFRENGVDPEKPIISTCGTGVTACVLETALEVAGIGSEKTRQVYDGSWTEWAQRVRPSDSLIRTSQ